MDIPPIEVLLDISKKSLEDLLLISLNREANLAKVTKRELDCWVEESRKAGVIRWMIENREELLRHKELSLAPHKVEFLSDVKKTA